MILITNEFDWLPKSIVSVTCVQVRVKKDRPWISHASPTFLVWGYKKLRFV
jgi:hypothetical protein